MEDRHAATTPYQQRIWKVSRALDQLALACEQHHLQTKHVDGLPDWAVHKTAAGVPSPARPDVPSNFAWRESEKFDLGKDSGRMERDELGAVDEEDDERVTQELRASTSDLMSRLAPPSLSSSVSSTAAVFPLSASKLSQQKTSKPLESFSYNHSSHGSHQSMASQQQTNSASKSMVREAGEPHRRRKVHFADQGRSYRGDRPTKRVSDLTYREALRAITPTVHYPPETRSTYQEMYQWPTRDAYVAIMDKVGGQTAGGETRYEPRRVFTAEEAMFVANESARDLLKKTMVKRVENESSQEAAAAKTVEVEGERNADASPPMLDEVKNGEKVPSSEESPESMGDEVQVNSAEFLVPRGVTASDKIERSRYTLQPPAPSTISPATLEKRDQRSSELPTTDSFVEVSTQTKPSRSATTARTHKNQQLHKPTSTTRASPPANHSHFARSNDVAEKKKIAPQTSANQTEIPRRLRKAVLKDAVPRATRGNLPQQRCNQQQQRGNPIFLNARYPAEPSVFRAKSTYATEYGSKPSKIR